MADQHALQRQSQYAGRMKMIHRTIAARTRTEPMSTTRAVTDRGLDHANRTTIHTISAARTVTTASARMLRSGNDDAGQTPSIASLV